ncbi:MAG: hypothetical protein FWC61_02755 [Proteobacteria bacterium]|nr:hypothetical protein [Pseudomonadota bacterium]
MKNSLLVAVVATVLPLAACADKSDYNVIAAQIANCKTVQPPLTQGGDYLVLCDATDQLVAISQKEKTEKFMTGVQSGDDIPKMQQPGKILINVVPNENCYRVLGDGVDLTNLPTGDRDWYAVKVCAE